MAAFLGSVFIIKPGFQNAALLAALAGVVGGMGAGIAYTFVRALGQKGEDSRRFVFYFSAFSCLLCLPFLFCSFRQGLDPKTGQYGPTVVFAGLAEYSRIEFGHSKGCRTEYKRTICLC